MLTKDEDDAISALTGFSLDNILTGLQLPSNGLSNRLGISGLSALNSSQIYNDRWDGGAVGTGLGEDYEDEVDREIEEEEEEDDAEVKMEEDSPDANHIPERRVRTVKRLVERPKTVYERFPMYEKDKVLNFTELFKGYTGTKSRLVKRPFYGACRRLHYTLSCLTAIQWIPSTPRRKKYREVSWTLLSETRRERSSMSVSTKPCRQVISIRNFV